MKVIFAVMNTTWEVVKIRPKKIKAWTGLRPYFHYCSSIVFYREDHFHIHVFIRSSNIWLSYIYSRILDVYNSLIQSNFDFCRVNYQIIKGW